MSAKNFRFRSPGIKIEEIDESIINVPIESEVGPVIVGRSQFGPILKPVVVSSVDEFTRTFGVPSPGGFADSDLWRGENRTAPDYGAYAALAYLRNSAPVTFLRLGGVQHPNVDTSTTYGQAGWQTTKTTPATLLTDNGGAYGLWLLPSSSAADKAWPLGAIHGTGSLAAVFYMNSGSGISVMSASTTPRTKQLLPFSGQMHTADIQLQLTSSTAGGFDGKTVKTMRVSMDPSKGNFIRKVFNTSPIETNSTVVDSGKSELYWLGETFEDNIKELSDSAGTGFGTYAFISPLVQGSVEKGNYRYPAKAAKTGYVISQDLGIASEFDPLNTPTQRLFRIIGLTEGSWASKNLKISISNITYTAIDQDADPYGTFNVEVRSLGDSDDNPVLLESFESVNLNPRSARFIGRVIGDQYLKWDYTNDKIEIYGDYPNNSRYVRVDVHPTVKAGGVDAKLLPFGFLGPARRKKFQIFSGSTGGPAQTTFGYTDYASSYAYDTTSYNQGEATSYIFDQTGNGEKALNKYRFTGSLVWPDYLLRVTASNATRGLAKNAYFGIRTSRADSGRYPSPAYADLTYPLEEEKDSWIADNSTTFRTFAFSLDDVRQASSSTKGWTDNAIYATGSRVNTVTGFKSITQLGAYYKAEGSNKVAAYRYQSGDGWKVVLDAGYKAFTMPMHGGFDGVDIKQKNPFSIVNIAKDGGSSTDGRGNYAWYSVLTAIKMLRDPEFLDFNLAAVPGLVDSTLNTKLADYCRDRGDALAILDIDSGYRPIEDIRPSELTATGKRGTVSGAVADRRDNLSTTIHSYAATFYPWVDIHDGRTRSVVASPPTVAMMGVFGRVKQTSEVWFAPAGFSRGGLSDGTTGLRVVNVKDRLTSAERDELYDHGINPIANFPAEGIVVFGQKTLQLERSALDRINVRRLLIYLKRKIGAVARNVLFEQNVESTWNSFSGDAKGILEEVKDGLGIVDYKFVLDGTTTTPDMIDQNILYAKLFIKPARAIEFIALDFIITKTGAQFPE